MNNIPGNKNSEFGRIFEDTTLEALESHLAKIVGSQAASKRNNPRYIAETKRIRRAIAARKN